MKKNTKKAIHAMDFAEYAAGWHPSTSMDYDEPMWRNAPEGWVPSVGELEILTTEQLYKRFIKETKKQQP